jgi:hypothetical protein
VAVSPLTRTHSCDFVYFKSEGMLLIKIWAENTRIWKIENTF